MPGVIDIGDNIGVVMKMESHNHPSAVEPFQGAATGVGGILRDIFTMGARPIAGLNSLRFGPIDGPENAHTRYLFEHVVGGISHYGNCLAGEELFSWRSAKIRPRMVTIGEFVETHLRPGQDTTDLDPNLGVETLSFDPKTLKSCWQPVRRVFRRRTKDLVRIYTNNGNAQGELGQLTTTPDHPMIVIEPNPNSLSVGIEVTVKLAGSLCPGDMLPCLLDPVSHVTGEGGPLDKEYLSFEMGDIYGTKVESIDRVPSNECSVYDVEVDGTHLFATSWGIITHNCVGVPTVGGEIYFHPSYTGNPLVNAMAVGLVPMDKIASAGAKGVGNPVLYVGSATGKDGIHGATFASVELGPDSESKRPNVQMGDPVCRKAAD